MSLVISGLNLERYNEEKEYRESVAYNISLGWIFVCFRDKSPILEYTKKSDKILIHYKRGDIIETKAIPLTPGIYIL